MRRRRRKLSRTPSPLPKTERIETGGRATRYRARHAPTSPAARQVDLAVYSLAAISPKFSRRMVSTLESWLQFG